MTATVSEALLVPSHHLMLPLLLLKNTQGISPHRIYVISCTLDWWTFDSLTEYVKIKCRFKVHWFQFLWHTWFTLTWLNEINRNSIFLKPPSFAQVTEAKKRNYGWGQTISSSICGTLNVSGIREAKVEMESSACCLSSLSQWKWLSALRNAKEYGLF